MSVWEVRQNRKKKGKKKAVYLSHAGEFQTPAGFNGVCVTITERAKEAHWVGAGDEREGSEEVCIWQLRRHKGKQTTCFAEKPLSCCTIDACYYWPTLSILLHKGKQPLSHNSTLPRTEGVCQLRSSSALWPLKTSGKMLGMFLNWETAWDMGRSSVICCSHPALVYFPEKN